MKIISIFQPTKTLSAVGPGTVHTAERWVRAITHPFQVSLKKSSPSTVNAANTGFQLPVSLALAALLVVDVNHYQQEGDDVPFQCGQIPQPFQSLNCCLDHANYLLNNIIINLSLLEIEFLRT
jgi:hypothetical protein